jgi:hypothetical protein
MIPDPYPDAWSWAMILIPYSCLELSHDPDPIPRCLELSHDPITIPGCLELSDDHDPLPRCLELSMILIPYLEMPTAKP